MPQRIQRKRTKGWRMPPNTLSVTRPSAHSNPYRVERLSGPRSERGEEWIVVDTRTDAWAFPWTVPSKDAAANLAIDCFESEIDEPKIVAIRADLSGRDLACWCSLDQPCHADVLLELANQ